MWKNGGSAIEEQGVDKPNTRTKISIDVFRFTKYKEVVEMSVSENLKTMMEVLVGQAYKEGYEAGKSAAASIVEGAQETIEHKGLVLRKVEREARRGDYVRVQHTDGYCFKPNKLYGPVENGSVKADSSTGRKEFEMSKVYNEFYGRDASTIEVFEVVGAIPQNIKSPNQQRAELIQRAREFVNKYQADPQDVDGHGVGNYTAKSCFYETEFHVKNNKVTAVVYPLILGNDRTMKPRHVGRAICAPGDVFNADIGKAIALARALEIDVPGEFLNAVRPIKAPGMIVRHPLSSKCTTLIANNRIQNLSEANYFLSLRMNR